MNITANIKEDRDGQLRNNPSKRLRIPEISENMFACGIRNPGNFGISALRCGIQLKEFGNPLTVGIYYQKFTEKEYGNHGVESKIQDCLEFHCLRTAFAWIF